MTTAGETPQLEYAPRRDTGRRKRIYRWLIVIAVLFAAWRLWDSRAQITRSVKIAWLKRQCIKHPIPEEVVVYSSDNPNGAVHSTEWDAFSAFVNLGTNTRLVRPDQKSTIFLGELRAGDGTRCLVEVEGVYHFETGNIATVTFFANYHGGNISGNYVNGQSYTREKISKEKDPLKPDVIVTSATRDPNDRSHVIFHIRAFGVAHQVDVRSHRRIFSLDLSDEPAK